MSFVLPKTVTRGGNAFRLALILALTAPALTLLTGPAQASTGTQCSAYWTGHAGPAWTTPANWSATDGGPASTAIPGVRDVVCMSTHPTQAKIQLLSRTQSVAGIQFPVAGTVRPSLRIQGGTLLIGSSLGAADSVINNLQIDSGGMLGGTADELLTGNTTLPSGATLAGPGVTTLAEGTTTSTQGLTLDLGRRLINAGTLRHDGCVDDIHVMGNSVLENKGILTGASTCGKGIVWDASFSAPTPTVGPEPAPSGMLGYDTFAAKPDGPLGIAASGQPWKGWGTGGTGIVNGRMTVIRSPGSGYFQLDAGRAPTQLGSDFTLSPGTEPGSAGTHLFKMAAPGLDNIAMHLSIGPDRWWVTTRTDGSELNNMALGRSYGVFSPPLPTDGKTVLQVSAEISGDVVRIQLPDGTTTVVSDPAIDSGDPARYPTWETYHPTVASNQAKFLTVWAGSGDVGTIAAPVATRTPCAVVNDSGATINVDLPADTDSYAIDPPLTNHGTLSVSKGRAVVGQLGDLVDGTLTDGTYRADDSVLQLPAAVTSNAATIGLSNQGRLLTPDGDSALADLRDNTGSIDLDRSLILGTDVTNSGELTLTDSTLSPDGYSATPDSVLVLLRGADASQLNPSRLSVAGPAVLAGDVRLVSESGRPAPVGTAYVIVSATSITGRFDSVSDTAGTRYAVDYGPNDVTLTVLAHG